MTDELKRIVDGMKKCSVSALSDALDKLGIPGGLLGIGRVSTRKNICGPAFTVRYVPCGVSEGTVGDFLDEVKPGEVVVIDNHGRTDCTVWGDIMSFHAANIGVEGTVIDGVCRDLDQIEEINYPIFSKGVYMMTGKNRVMAVSVNESIAICGRQVRPGDIIRADGSGAIVIPVEFASKALEIAERIEEAEGRIMSSVSKGISLKEARKINGYHSLQTKKA